LIDAPVVQPEMTDTVNSKPRTRVETPPRLRAENDVWIDENKADDVAGGWLVACGVIQHPTCSSAHPSDPHRKNLGSFISACVKRTEAAARRVTEAERLAMSWVAAMSSWSRVWPCMGVVREFKNLAGR
jgi:hypothetical protein